MSSRDGAEREREREKEKEKRRKAPKVSSNKGKLTF
jgi:hypothetical protein